MGAVFEICKEQGLEWIKVGSKHNQWEMGYLNNPAVNRLRDGWLFLQNNNVVYF